MSMGFNRTLPDSDSCLAYKTLKPKAPSALQVFLPTNLCDDMHFIRTAIFAFALCTANVFAASLPVPRQACPLEYCTFDSTCPSECPLCEAYGPGIGVSDEQLALELSHSSVQYCRSRP